MPEVYCVKCKAKREAVDTKKVTMKNGKPALEGLVTDETGAPQGNAPVTLLLAGKRFSTRTDAQGRYQVVD